MGHFRRNPFAVNHALGLATAGLSLEAVYMSLITRKEVVKA